MEITSNWSSENGLFLQEIVQEADTLPSGDLVTLLDEDKCISLTKNEQENGQECVIRFASLSGTTKLPPPVDVGLALPVRRKCINGMMILSEARLIEICLGNHEEYHKTTQGTLMGDFGDSKIYKCEVQFEKPQDIVVLKLKGLYQDDSVWIYGLHLVVTSKMHDLECGRVNRFGGEHLSTVLKDKDVHMSKQALKFHQMLECFNKDSSDQNNKFIGSNPMSFMSLMFASNTIRSKEMELDAQNGNERCDSKEITNDKNPMQMSEMLGVIHQLGPHKNDKEKECNRLMNTETEYKQNIEGDLKKQMKNHFGQELFAAHTRSGGQAFGLGGRDQRESPVQIANLFEKIQRMSTEESETPKEFMNFQAMLNEVLHAQNGSKQASGSNRYDNQVYKGKNNGTAHVEPNFKCEQDSEVFRTFENMIDKKLASMEERIMKKIEQKLEEKAVEDTQRLKHLEELFSKIYEKL